MAQTNYTPIILYNSGTTTNAPSASNLASGELAINYTDGKLFYKDNSSAVQVIAWKTTPTTAGGTGLTSYTAGDLPYYASGSALSKLGIGTSGYVLQSNGSAPTWVAQSTLSVGTATNATNTAITDNTSSSATWYPTVVSATTGNLPQTTSSTKLSFVPSTGVLTTNGYTNSALSSAGVLTNNASGVFVSSAQLASTYATSGNIIQVVQGTITAQVSTTSTSYVTTGLSASITPQFSTSKILILVSSTAYIPTASIGAQPDFTIYRSGSNIGNSAGFSNLYSPTVAIITPLAFHYVDSPASTSALTYAVYFANAGNSSTIYFGSGGFANNQISSLILMEIR